MARKRAKGRSSHLEVTHSKGGGGVASVGDEFEKLTIKISEAGLGLADFAKQALGMTDEFKRAQAGLQELRSAYAFPAAQGLAAEYAPSLSPAIANLRGNLGFLASEGSAVDQLKSLAAAGAEAGVPYQKDELGDFFQLLMGREKTKQQALQDAQDVAYNVTGGTGIQQGLKEAFVEPFQDAGKLIAYEVGQVLREYLGFGGGGGR